MNETDILKLLKALADANRLRIVRSLTASGELSCGEIAERFPIAQATVSHHLKVLVESGLLNVRREGQFAYFTLNSTLAGQFGSALGGVLPEMVPQTKHSPT